MNIPANAEIQGMTCSGCHHALSSHELTTMYKAKNVNAKCKKCECDGALSID